MGYYSNVKTQDLPSLKLFKLTVIVEVLSMVENENLKP